MLRFAGYMVASAGGATGVWAASGAATNAFVGFATNLLESSFHRGSNAALEQLQTSSGGLGAALQRRKRQGLQVENRRSRLSNQHRHQEGVECLDLALPFPPLMDDDTASKVVSQLMVMMVGCSCVYATATVMHEWLAFISAHPLPSAATEEGEGRNAGHEEELFPSEQEETVTTGSSSSPPRRTASIKGPTPSSPGYTPVYMIPEGMHNSNLVSTSTIRRTSSKSVSGRRRGVNAKPSIHEIRKYFLAPEADVVPQEQSPDAGILSSSAPVNRSNACVPLVSPFAML